MKSILGWFKCFSQRQSGAAIVAASLFALISYNLYFVCQIKQHELEDRQVELDSLRSELSLAEFSNSQLKAQVAYLATDAGAEEVAREKLGLVKYGEVSFVVLGGENLLQPPLKPKVVVEENQSGLVMRFMHWFLIG